MRRGFGYVDVLIGMIVFAFTLYLLDAVTLSGEMKNRSREIFEARSQANSYLEKAKFRCASEGVGNWTENIRLLGKYDRTVEYGCELAGGDLYRVHARVCNPDTNKCLKGLNGYVYIKK